MISPKEIFEYLPYAKPFLFVDEIVSYDANSIIGRYNFKLEEYFYKGHFVGYPVTPGVILTECMAQIGLVCLGIINAKIDIGSVSSELSIAMTNSNIDFLKPVFPGTKVTVEAEKVYLRFNKLKAKVRMFDGNKDCVAQGTISGMIVNQTL